MLLCPGCDRKQHPQQIQGLNHFHERRVRGLQFTSALAPHQFVQLQEDNVQGFALQGMLDDAVVHWLMLTSTFMIDVALYFPLRPRGLNPCESGLTRYDTEAPVGLWPVIVVAHSGWLCLHHTY
jgi:hypothetical protein